MEARSRQGHARCPRSGTLTGHRATVATVTLTAVGVGHHVVIGTHGGGYEAGVTVFKLRARLEGGH